MCLFPILRVCVAAIASLALTAPLAAQSRLATDLARYEQDSDPVHKSRDLVKLGDDQIEESRKQLKAGDDVGSLHTLEQYRDEIRHMADRCLSINAPSSAKSGRIW